MASNRLLRQRMINKANRSLRVYYNTADGLLPVYNSTASREKSKA